MKDKENSILLCIRRASAPGRRLLLLILLSASPLENADAQTRLTSGVLRPITDIQDELTYCIRLSLLALHGTPASRR